MRGADYTSNARRIAILGLLEHRLFFYGVEAGKSEDDITVRCKEKEKHKANAAQHFPGRFTGLTVLDHPGKRELAAVLPCRPGPRRSLLCRPRASAIRYICYQSPRPAAIGPKFYQLRVAQIGTVCGNNKYDVNTQGAAPQPLPVTNQLLVKSTSAR